MPINPPTPQYGTTLRSAHGYEGSIGYGFFMPLEEQQAVTDTLITGWTNKVEGLTGGLEYGCLLSDDFFAGSLANAWTTSATGSAAVTVPNNFRNGAAQLSTGATASSTATLQTAAMFDPAASPVFLTRVQIKTGSLTGSSITINLGFGTQVYASAFDSWYFGINGVQKQAWPIPWLNTGQWLPIKIAMSTSAQYMYIGNVCVGVQTLSLSALQSVTISVTNGATAQDCTIYVDYASVYASR